MNKKVNKKTLPTVSGSVFLSLLVNLSGVLFYVFALVRTVGAAAAAAAVFARAYH